MLDDERQFRYDLLLGCSWLRRHNATPRWDDDAHELTHPEDKTKFYVKPIPAKEQTGITKLLTKLAWRLHPKQIGPPRIQPLHCAQNEGTVCDGIPIVAAECAEDTTFGERLKKIVKGTVPSIFKDKVGFTPLQKWVHEIDTGNVKPIWRYD